MKKVNNRALRMSEQIHKDIMLILRTKVKDPRIEWVTVNEVTISKDYSLAKIYYSVMIKEQQDKVALALESAKGYIRSELSKGLTTYTVPQLQFVFDQSLERGMHILGLISQVNQSAESEYSASLVETNEEKL